MRRFLGKVQCAQTEFPDLDLYGDLLDVYELDFDSSTMPVLMDSFSEPYTRQGDDISIEQARHNIALIEQQHRNAGIPLSGRIIHVCHYLPITPTITSKSPSNASGVLSPPATPPFKPSDPVWSLAPRYGHSAMISGIRSLSYSHEQLIVGWTGDVTSLTEKVPVDTISPDERLAFEAALNEYLPDPDDEWDRKTKYVPVWLDDKVAHGHYDGYCKQSKQPLLLNPTPPSLTAI